MLILAIFAFFALSISSSPSSFLIAASRLAAVSWDRGAEATVPAAPAICLSMASRRALKTAEVTIQSGASFEMLPAVNPSFLRLCSAVTQKLLTSLTFVVSFRSRFTTSCRVALSAAMVSVIFDRRSRSLVSS